VFGTEVTRDGPTCAVTNKISYTRVIPNIPHPTLYEVFFF